MIRRRPVAVGAIAISIAMAAVATGSAGAATLQVACGTGDLVAKINAANGTAAHDTLELATNCTYELTAPAVVGNPAGNNVGLPLITQPLTIAGNGATIIRPNTAAQNFRLLFAIGGFSGLNGALELRDVNLFGGRLTTSGQHGAVIGALGVPVTLRNSVAAFGQTTSGRGGALAVVSGAVTIEDSLVALSGAMIGGGLYAANSPVAVRRSAFQQNAATVSSAAVFQEGRAGVYENATFAGNVTTNPNNRIGGLVVAECAASACGALTPGTATVQSSTFADNGRHQDPAPGAALTTFGAASSIAVEDTIVTDTDSTASDPGCLELGGDITSGGGNLEWPNASCGFATVANPKVLGLTASGLRRTYPLAPDSPAIDLGGEQCPQTDALLRPRPDGDGCDAGSFETHPPQTTADGPDGVTSDPVVTFAADESPVTFQCRLDGGDWTACTSPHTVDAPDGEHTLEVRATDASGYVDPSPASVTLTIDRTAPDTAITKGPSGTLYNDPAVFEFTASEPGGTFQCRMDAGPWEACTSPKSYGSLSSGSHTFAVRAVDAVGNADPTPASRTFRFQRCAVTRVIVNVLGQPVTVCVTA